VNTNRVARHYDRLTAEERFALIVQANTRGHKVESDRLVRAGRHIMLTLPGHAPHSFAFSEIANFTLLELLDAAASFENAATAARECQDSLPAGDLDNLEEDGTEEPGSDHAADVEQDDAQDPADWQCFDMMLAHGHVLKVKGDGWQTFCRRLNLPPFVFWQQLPGWRRLERALKVAERCSFTLDGMLSFMNVHRPDPGPEITADKMLTAESFASELEQQYRARVRFWDVGDQ
jgi:hypothetical protein